MSEPRPSRRRRGSKSGVGWGGAGLSGDWRSRHLVRFNTREREERECRYWHRRGLNPLGANLGARGVATETISVRQAEPWLWHCLLPPWRLAPVVDNFLQIAY